MKFGFLSSLKMLTAIACCVLMTGCGKSGDADLAGTYAAVIGRAKEGKKTVTVNLELKPDHKGNWTVEDNTTEFRWEIREGSLWMHTISGGVIVGEMEKNGFRIRLPGTEPGFFARVKE